MIYAQKGNQVSRIEEYQVNTLLEQGFNIIDENGKVLHEAVPTDPKLLKKYYLEFKTRIAELEKEVETLKKSAAKKTVAKEEKVESEDVAEETDDKIEEVPKPKRGRK